VIAVVPTTSGWSAVMRWRSASSDRPSVIASMKVMSSNPARFSGPVR